MVSSYLSCRKQNEHIWTNLSRARLSKAGAGRWPGPSGPYGAHQLVPGLEGMTACLPGKGPSGWSEAAVPGDLCWEDSLAPSPAPPSSILLHLCGVTPSQTGQPHRTPLPWLDDGTPARRCPPDLKQLEDSCVFPSLRPGHLPTLTRASPKYSLNTSMCTKVVSQSSSPSLAASSRARDAMRSFHASGPAWSSSGEHGNDSR